MVCYYKSFLSVQFQTALDIRQSVFGGKNIHVATAHEDLAYSSYVHQYSSGKFDNALWVQLNLQAQDCEIKMFNNMCFILTNESALH